MPNLLLGNPLQSYNEGVQTGQTNRFNALAGQAIAAPADQQQGLIAQAAQADPVKALALKGTLTQQADTDEDRRNKTLVNMSKLLVAAPDAYKDQVYQQIRPSLAGLGLTQAPANYNDEIGQTAKSIVDAYTPLNAQPSGLREIQGQITGAGLTGDEAKKAYRVSLGLDPRAVTGAAKTGMITGADGRERPFTFDPSTQQYKVFDGQAFRPLDQTEQAQLGSGGQPTAPAAATPPRVSTDELMRQATKMANQDGPGKNADQAQAWLKQQLIANGYKTAPAGAPAPTATSSVGGLGVGRAPEDTAGAVQNARNASDLAYLPQQKAIENSAAVDAAGRTVTAKGEAERALDRPQAQAALQDATTNLDRMSQAANDLINHPGLNGITSWSAKVPDAPGSDAANARALLVNLKSQIGFGVLQAMRNASKTGGALGSVSDAEGVRLENNLASLEQSQSPAAFKANLHKVIEYVNQTKSRLGNAYNQTYQGNQGAQAPTAAHAPQTQADYDALPSGSVYTDPDDGKTYRKP